jgi:hypothetical protein
MVLLLFFRGLLKSAIIDDDMLPPLSCSFLELNALRADFTNLQHNKDLHHRHIAIQAYGV